MLTGGYLRAVHQHGPIVMYSVDCEFVLHILFLARFRHDLVCNLLMPIAGLHGYMSGCKAWSSIEAILGDIEIPCLFATRRNRFLHATKELVRMNKRRRDAGRGDAYLVGLEQLCLPVEYGREALAAFNSSLGTKQDIIKLMEKDPAGLLAKLEAAAQRAAAVERGDAGEAAPPAAGAGAVPEGGGEDTGPVVEDESDGASDGASDGDSDGDSDGASDGDSDDEDEDEGEDATERNVRVEIEIVADNREQPETEQEAALHDVDADDAIDAWVVTGPRNRRKTARMRDSEEQAAAAQAAGVATEEQPEANAHDWDEATDGESVRAVRASAASAARKNVASDTHADKSSRTIRERALARAGINGSLCMHLTAERAAAVAMEGDFIAERVAMLIGDPDLTERVQAAEESTGAKIEELRLWMQGRSSAAYKATTYLLLVCPILAATRRAGLEGRPEDYLTLLPYSILLRLEGLNAHDSFPLPLCCEYIQYCNLLHVFETRPDAAAAMVASWCALDDELQEMLNLIISQAVGTNQEKHGGDPQKMADSVEVQKLLKAVIAGETGVPSSSAKGAQAKRAYHETFSRAFGSSPAAKKKRRDMALWIANTLAEVGKVNDPTYEAGKPFAVALSHLPGFLERVHDILNSRGTRAVTNAVLQAQAGAPPCPPEHAAWFNASRHRYANWENDGRFSASETMSHVSIHATGDAMTISDVIFARQGQQQ